MVQDSPSRHLPQFQLRLTPELKEQITEAAKASKRTMNAEIVARLEMTFATGATFHESGFDLPIPSGGSNRTEVTGLEKRMEELEGKVAALEQRLAGS